MTWRKALSTLCACCLALAAMILAGGCSPGTSGAVAVAATFGDVQVTESEVNDYTADFRARNDLEDDEAWADYLSSEGLTAKTWRERAISSIVKPMLLKQKAAEKGIAPDETRIDEQIAADKESAGIDKDDEEAWERYLASTGTDAERYRADLEAASVEQQLIMEEVGLNPIESADTVNSYIDKNLKTRVVRRYRVLIFDTAEAAQAAIDDMAGLSGDELAARFDTWLDRDDSDVTTTAGGGDMGWDIASNLGAAQDELNQEMVEEGELSTAPHEIDGKYYVFLCRKRFIFEEGTTYDDLADDEMKNYVLTSATIENWATLTDNYVSKLLEDAGVQVSPMPSGLPYDVDNMIDR